MARQLGRELILWPGFCPTHHRILVEDIARQRAAHPGAVVAAHPECPSEILEKADFIGSTSAIIRWCASAEASDIIVVTESGVARSLKRVAPGKRFHFIANEQCNCSECPYMKRNTLEKLRDSLITLTPRVELSGDIIRRALIPIERMLAVNAR